jgi:hypothetical protein
MDQGVVQRLYGNYRAKVVNNKDSQKYGRVLVWIPDLMPELDSRFDGIWARPANNPIGGRNTESGSIDNYYAGTSFIPANGSWTWVFFEAGNINRPYYFGALDLENAKVLPENQVGNDYQNKWTIFKSHEGRAVVISDDPDDERVEITGKKSLMAEPPSGDTFSVYRIDQNQNTILLDERDDTEKLLIKTHKGDFIKLGIKDRTLEIWVASNVEIKSGGHVLVTSTGDQHFLAGKNVHITAGENIHILSGGTTTIETGDEMNLKCGGSANETVAEKKTVSVQEELYLKGKEIHEQGADLIARDASSIEDNSGSSNSPPSATIDATIASSATPVGDRDNS